MSKSVGELITLKNVSKHLGKFHLDNISFSLPRGYIMGLIGPNGAGKTTLIHILLGLYSVDQGEVWIDHMQYDGKEYGSFFKKFDLLKYQNYLEKFGLDAKQKFRTLSKGEKLKTQFAFALSHDAKLLVLDEPAGNFDVRFREDSFTF